MNIEFYRRESALLNMQQYAQVYIYTLCDALSLMLTKACEDYVSLRVSIVHLKYSAEKSHRRGRLCKYVSDEEPVLLGDIQKMANVCVGVKLMNKTNTSHVT